MALRSTLLIALVGGTLCAGCTVAVHGRNTRSQHSQDVPAGHLPPPGMCRVWYDDRPAGHQPPPVSCSQARTAAARSRNARVIYGADRGADGRR